MVQYLPENHRFRSCEGEVAMITFRRYYIDSLLKEYSSLIKGVVLDIGGKRKNRRGNFSPESCACKTWKYLNIDKASKPDYLASADSIPADPETFDTVIMCETIEHLENPDKALGEALRVMKRNGVLIITVPFLFPFHPDPVDYQRWTAQKINSELSRIGFGSISIKPMGGMFSVIFDLVHVFTVRNPKQRSFLNRALINLKKPVARIFMLFEKMFPWTVEFMTTGYFVIAYKG
ncbi:class I SAM-dependent methyltransferase [bacterium]|nr:MAG: class I SAM-dependent methyltransferase [bacterium]